MSGAPRISVVLIVLDGEDFLREALDSVVAQSASDWELIAVDDGSTDGTAAILDEYAQALDGRMRIARHACGDNLGMAASRNLGVRNSRGAYLTFLDHDDVMLPRKLQEQADLLDRHQDAACVIGPNIRWHSWAEGRPPDEIQDLGLPADRLAYPPGPLPVFLRRTVATPQGFMIRREAFEAIGGYEESFGGMYEDQAMQAKLYLRYPVYVAGAVWHRYRQHRASCVAQTFRAGARRLVRRRFLRWLEKYLRRSGVGAPALLQIVRDERARTRFARAHWLAGQARLGLLRLAGRRP